MPVVLPENPVSGGVEFSTAADVRNGASIDLRPGR
jgi:hypothetical protein